MALKSKHQVANHDAVLLTDPLARAATTDDGDAPAVTFLDYSTSKDGISRSLTRAELFDRVSSVAAFLQQQHSPGDRVAIMAPQSLEYVVGFLGAVHAGLVAVPLFTPDLPGHSDRLSSVLADCAPTSVLTTRAALDQVISFTEEHDSVQPTCVAVENIDTPAEQYRHPGLTSEDLAYLQYTSGSTRTPAGVEITHKAVLANAAQALAAYGGNLPGAVTVSWLPLFHDMGLVLAVAAPVVGSIPSVLLDPVAFLQRPARWLRALSANPRAITAAPNFAYDYCASRITDEEKPWIRLHDVISMINGSEPVRAGTMRRFHEAFAGCGLPRSAQRCSYGLAEATVFVAAGELGTEATVVPLDRAQLSEGVAVRTEVESEASVLVGCGTPLGQQVAIVDSGESRAVPDGTVGEIWVHGPNLGRGFWGRGVGDSFETELKGDGTSTPSSGWLRTGDLGVSFEGELFITGRIKDLIIVDGRNHYPQDIEETTEAAHTSIRRKNTAAFSIPDGDEEKLVVVAEYQRDLAEADRDPVAITRAVRRSITARHSVSLHDLVLVEPRTVPRTSSGKVARQACRERYLAGRMNPEASA